MKARPVKVTGRRLLRARTKSAKTTWSPTPDRTVEVTGHTFAYRQFKKLLGWAPPPPDEKELDPYGISAEFGPAVEFTITTNFTPREAARAKVRTRRTGGKARSLKRRAARG